MKQAAKRSATLKPSRTKVNSRGELTAVSSVNYWTGVAIKVAVALAILGAFVWIISPTAHAGDEPHTETVIVTPVPDHQISVAEQQLEAGAVPSEQAEEVLPVFPIEPTSSFLGCMSDAFALRVIVPDEIFAARLYFLKEMAKVCREYSSLGENTAAEEAEALKVWQFQILEDIMVLGD